MAGRTSYTVQAGKDEITFEAPDGLTDAQITQIADQHLKDAKPGQTFSHSLMDPRGPKEISPAPADTGDIKVTLPEPKSELGHNLSVAAGIVPKALATAPFGLADLADFAVEHNPISEAVTGNKKTLDEYMSTDAMAPKVRNWLAQNLGMDEPTSAGGRLVDAGIGGLVGGPKGWARLAGSAGGVISQLVQEGGGSTTAQIIAGLLAGHSPNLVANGARRLIRGNTAPQIGQAVSDFVQAGTTPSVGQAMDTPKMLLKEQGANTAAFAGPQLAVQRVAQSRDIGAHINSIVDSLVGGKAPSPAKAGVGFVQNMIDKFKPGEQAKNSAGYNLYDKLVSPDTPVDAAPLKAFIDQSAEPIPGLENTSAAPGISTGMERLAPAVSADLADKFSKILGADGKPINLGPGPIPVSSIKALKTRVGQMLEDSIISPDANALNTRQARALYGKLSEIERSAALKADGGKPGLATAQYDSNNAAVTKYHDTLDQVRLAVNKGTGEDTFSNLVTRLDKGSTKLDAAYSTLDPAGQQVMSSAILKNQVLKPSKGMQNLDKTGFSLDQTLDNWNNLHEDVQATVLKGMGPGYAANFQKVLQVMEKIKEQKAFAGDMPATPTKGFGHLATTSLIGGEGYSLSSGHTGLAALIGLAAGGKAAYGNVLPRIMTNPKAVAWLARTNDIPAKALPMALQQLGQIAARSKDKDLADAVAEMQSQQGQ